MIATGPDFIGVHWEKIPVVGRQKILTGQNRTIATPTTGKNSQYLPEKIPPAISKSDELEAGRARAKFQVLPGAIVYRGPGDRI